MTLSSIAPRQGCAPGACARWLTSRAPYWCLLAGLVFQLGASYRTANFVVTAPTADAAREMGQAAEHHRRRLATEWLGRELVDWESPCPLRVETGPRLPPSGSTSCVYRAGRAVDWRMAVQGPRERVLSAVLPHEVAHTVLSTHFGRPLPRWVEEGICASIEDKSSRASLAREAKAALLAGKASTVQKMLSLMDYPAEMAGFYAQGYSLTQFLLDRGGPRKLLRCIADAVGDGDWERALGRHYGYAKAADLQRAWRDWLFSTGEALEA